MIYQAQGPTSHIFNKVQRLQKRSVITETQLVFVAHQTLPFSCGSGSDLRDYIVLTAEDRYKTGKYRQATMKCGVRGWKQF